MSTPENYIPWEQIEPLLEPGMTGADLKRKLCAMTGLDAERFRFVTRGHSALTTSFAEALRHGLWVEAVDRPDRAALYLPARDELVAP